MSIEAFSTYFRTALLNHYNFYVYSNLLKLA